MILYSTIFVAICQKWDICELRRSTLLNLTGILFSYVWLWKLIRRTKNSLFSLVTSIATRNLDSWLFFNRYSVDRNILFWQRTLEMCSLLEQWFIKNGHRLWLSWRFMLFVIWLYNMLGGWFRALRKSCRSWNLLQKIRHFFWFETYFRAF